MAILNFQKPDKVIMIDSSESHGKFEFRPLEPGYGLTIGNALRRVLLSSLEGYAFTSIKIDGVDHEFSTIEGVVEDVTEIILNIKQIRLKRQIDDTDNEKVSIIVGNQKVLKASDLQKFISGFQILNPDLVICNLGKDVKLSIELNIEMGRGYEPAEENKRPSESIGLIPIDSIFTPIKNVKYDIENYRVEQKTDYEKLVFEIVTDGSIHPKDALTEAAKILIHHFMLFSDELITLEADEIAQSETYDAITGINIVKGDSFDVFIIELLITQESGLVPNSPFIKRCNRETCLIDPEMGPFIPDDIEEWLYISFPGYSILRDSNGGWILDDEGNFVSTFYGSREMTSDGSILHARWYSEFEGNLELTLGIVPGSTFRSYQSPQRIVIEVAK